MISKILSGLSDCSGLVEKRKWNKGMMSGIDTMVNRAIKRWLSVLKSTLPL